MRFIILCASAALLTAFTTTKRTNGDIQAELEAMYDTDQSQLKEIGELRKRYGSDDAPEMTDLWRKQLLINKTNIERLVKIIEEIGWPGRHVVGEKGANAAFLILQHADYAFQKKYFPLLREAVRKDQARPWNLGLLEDRILIREGKKQIYGSQWRKNDKGIMEPHPIGDEANVDKRRQAIHMRPIAEEAADYGVEYHPK
jgi:FMN phosphatase YigB (HAD superfamily)